MMCSENGARRDETWGDVDGFVLAAHGIEHSEWRLVIETTAEFALARGGD
jgi:hypothetical protein